MVSDYIQSLLVVKYRENSHKYLEPNIYQFIFVLIINPSVNTNWLTRTNDDTNELQKNAENTFL